jgi:hypothetical protein
MRPPLFARHDQDEADACEGPFEGMPACWYSGANRWVTRHFFLSVDALGERIYNGQELEEAQRYFRIPLDWTSTEAALRSLIGALADNRYGPAILDWCAGRTIHQDRLDELEAMLRGASSEWTVGWDEHGVPELQHRIDRTVTVAVRTSAGDGSRPAHYLATAWSKVYGQHPDPSAGYAAAVKAVEAAAKPVVSPNNTRTTLGTLIRDMRAAPHKWKTVLEPSSGGSGVPEVIGIMELLWTSHLDRHGSSSPSAPLSVSAPEAEAGVHLAATLVHLFQSGAISVI